MTEPVQSGQPSGQNPIRANRRLGWYWVLFPAAIVVVMVVLFGLKALL